jgi:branched-chain amino acid transport system permease protein
MFDVSDVTSGVDTRAVATRTLAGVALAVLAVAVVAGAGVDPVNVTVNWLLLSALYALVAIGFTLIFGVGGVLNLAHGATITVGAYAAYFVADAAGSIWVGTLAAMAVPGLFSVLLYVGMVRYVKEHPVIVMILTLVSSLLVEQVILVLPGAGSQAKAVSSLLTGSVTVLGSGIQTNRIVVFVLSWVVIAALFLFVGRTKAGKAIVATSMSERGATLVGIDNERVFVYTWFIAGVLAGVAGLFLASFQTATPFMGRSPLLLSFSIVIVGGLGSIRGSVVGAYLVGLLDTVTVSVVSTRLSGLAPLVVLVLVLLIKPEGLYGREFVE